jgi:hypothetical protein
MNPDHKLPEVAASDRNRHVSQIESRDIRHPTLNELKGPWRFGEPPLPARGSATRQAFCSRKLAVLLVSAVCLFGVASLSPGKERHDSESGPLTKWKKYENGRFGFVLTYPASLIGSREADNGDGREFHTRDKEFSVAAFAHFFVPDSDDSFEARWQEELDTPDVTITYKKRADSWYVVSGLTKSGTEYYHKLMTKGKNWAAFHVTYPHAKHEKYDPWVERIAKEFVAFREGDYDRLD